MKRWHSTWLVFALLMLLAGGALAQTTDVPPDHWAYRAVLTLVERGYMDVAPDGAFDGTAPAERYAVAVAVGRLLEDIESGRVRIGSGVDTAMLRELEQEFRDELVQWYTERDRLEAAHAQTQRHIAVIDEQLGRLLVALDELHAAVRSELLAGLIAESERTDEGFKNVDGRFGQIEGRADELEARIEGVDSDLSLLAEDVDTRIVGLQQFINDLLGEHGMIVDAQLDEQGGELNSLRSRLQQLESIVEEQGDELDEIGVQLNNQVTEQVLALAFRLETIERSVQRLSDDLTSLAQVLTMAQKTTEEDVQGLRSDVDVATAALGRDVSALQGQVSALQNETGVLTAEMAALQQELSELHAVMGTSEDQIARMTERVRMQLDDQLALSLSRERQLERQLNELRAEFEGYKVQTEEELNSARNMGGMALGAAALAILLGLMN